MLHELTLSGLTAKLAAKFGDVVRHFCRDAGRVVRIVTGDRAEQCRRVAYVPRQWADLVE